MSNGDAITPPPAPKKGTPIIHQFEKETTALRLLAAVGMADAMIWGRAPETLSVGQLARLEIALALAGNSPVIVIDEWLANLDRPTARAVAWATQRALRSQGRGAILITAHDDLTQDTQPDIHIGVRWDTEPTITQATHYGRPCTILDDMQINRGVTADWNALKPLHYAAGNPATIHSVWTASHPSIDGPAGVMVMSYPDLHSAARNLATDKKYQNVKDRRVAQALNREVLKLSRIVIAPQIRGIGVAHLMLSQVIPQLGSRYVECVTAMGRWSGFLSKCGFEEVPQTCHPAEAAIFDWASQTAPPAAAYLGPDQLLEFVDTLSVRKRREARRLIWSVYHHFVLHRRTRTKAPKVVPGPEHHGWRDAADLASRRLHERPSYWITGPMDPMTGMPEPSTQQPGPRGVVPV